MRYALLISLILCQTIGLFAEASESEKLFTGEWVVVPANSPASFVFEFKENGRVINKTTNTVGTYEVLKDSRILMEFTGEIIVMEYYESDGSILLTGQVGMQVQPISLSFVVPTEENRAEVKNTYETRFKAQQEAIERYQKQAIEVAIKNNLRQLAAAAQQYMLENGETSVSYQKLIEEKLIEALTPINGELYDDLLVDMDTTELQVIDATGSVHKYSF
ncbi:MAG: hypothetical protein AB3N63_03610 [Puniceicoccaceae bacterium]